MEKSIAVLGGDARSAMLAKMLLEEGYAVSTWGIDAVNSVSLSEAVGAQTLLLPIPLSREGKLAGTELALEKLFSLLSPTQTIFAAGIRGSDYAAAGAYSLTLLDYTDSEAFCVENADITAEGALQLALCALPVTLRAAPCLVLGYGRIGKQLARRLHVLGAQVSVAARKRSDLAWAESSGCFGIDSGALSGRLSDFRAVFNTVPQQLLARERLEELRRDCVLIELASVPGFDMAAAQELGLRVIAGGGLPGRTAPETAAAAMKKTVLERLEEVYA